MIKAPPQQDSGHGTTLLITLLAQISQSGLGIVGIKLHNRPQIQDTAQAGLLRAQAHSFNIREMESLKILLGKVNTPQLMISNFFKAEIPEGGHSVCKENLTGLLRNLNGAIVVGTALPEEDKAFIAGFYKYGFVGEMLDWIRRGMKDDHRALARGIALTMQGSIDNAIRNFQEK